MFTPRVETTPTVLVMTLYVATMYSFACCITTKDTTSDLSLPADPVLLENWIS